MENTYFNKPTQVVFADPDNPGEWLAGIAYSDVIICGCCGGVFEIEDVVDCAKEDGIKNAIHKYYDWTDLADEIAGGELPETLDRNENGEIYEVPDEEYEQNYFSFVEEEEEEAQATATFANSWADSVVISSID